MFTRLHGSKAARRHVLQQLASEQLSSDGILKVRGAHPSSRAVVFVKTVVSGKSQAPVQPTQASRRVRTVLKAMEVAGISKEVVESGCSKQAATQIFKQFSEKAGVKMKPFSPETMAALKTGLKLSRAQYRLLVHGLIGHAGWYIAVWMGCQTRLKRHMLI